MIPGRANRLVVSAKEEGVYRGQCAEFCGGPHALMALHVAAQSQSEFDAWRAQQQRPASAGHALFLARCVRHAVRGTDAAGTRGPGPDPRRKPSSTTSLLAGILALIMRAQLARARNDACRPRLYNQLFTMHGTVMMFLFAVPAVEAASVYLLPNMLAARDLPFPRLSAYAFWAYFIGGSCSSRACSSGWRRTAAGSCTRRSPATRTRRRSTPTSGCSASASSRSRRSRARSRSSSACCAPARRA